MYGYPWAAAVEIALTETLRELTHAPAPARVVFACFSAEMAALYRATFARLAGGS